MKNTCLFILVMMVSVFLMGQSPSLNKATAGSDKIRVYFDCAYCDMNFIKEEIGFVNNVRDRSEAQVQIIMTSEMNGSGGARYSVMFYGLKNFEGIDDTLAFSVPSDATEEMIRDKYIATFKLGLMQYVIKTDAASFLSIQYNAPDTTAPPIDKWNNWVASVSGSFYLNGQKSYKSLSNYNSFNIYKVLPEWKTSFSFGNSYSESSYSYEEIDYYYKSINRSIYSSADYIGSISNHWSWGLFGAANSSTYSNINFSATLTPGIEYDIFPYKEATTRQVRCVYTIGPKYNIYNDTTIFDKTRELLFAQTLGVAAEVVQKWGSLSGSVTGNTYMHDLSKNSVDVYLNTSFRLFKGLELSVYAYYSMIHDQLGLPKGDVSQEELLLQQRQMQTQYSYYVSLGLSYTFGSIYNTVVNPRFGN
ncbi:MAG: hypothetical protein A2W93_10325 [Bacteroidetes bacterium GWF2_43_63]|nr:MAG: hypothetical protein A2W94_02145 [Bacteroidetes bacterium GWE2_42_42]OFY52917.1 MAG: hypothetical protein A2W93_10325 [Bacteroidetes bacterium GWF2_43_63]HBG70124.1 hypothetical protein [Bacteroidales bacterium]HCB62269.1 hypothetical protein [Bacteroidales bacterium]